MKPLHPWKIGWTYEHRNRWGDPQRYICTSFNGIGGQLVLLPTKISPRFDFFYSETNNWADSIYYDKCNADMAFWAQQKEDK